MDIFFWMCVVVVHCTGPGDKCPQCYHHCHQQCCHHCWFNHSLSMCPAPLEALCSMLIIKCCRPSAQKEGYLWSICQQRWQACPWEMSAVFAYIYMCDKFSITLFLTTMCLYAYQSEVLRISYNKSHKKITIGRCKMITKRGRITTVMHK